MLLVKDSIFIETDENLSKEKIYIKSVYEFNSKRYQEQSCQYYMTKKMLSQFHEATIEEKAFFELANKNGSEE